MQILIVDLRLNTSVQFKICDLQLHAILLYNWNKWFKGFLLRGHGVYLKLTTGNIDGHGERVKLVQRSWAEELGCICVTRMLPIHLYHQPICTFRNSLLLN